MADCSYCTLPLTLIHPWNSTLDMDICKNIRCPRYRQPQGYILNPENKAIFRFYDTVLTEGTNGKAQAILGTGVTTRLYDAEFNVSNGRRKVRGLEAFMARGRKR